MFSQKNASVSTEFVQLHQCRIPTEMLSFFSCLTHIFLCFSTNNKDLSLFQQMNESHCVSTFLKFWAEQNDSPLIQSQTLESKKPLGEGNEEALIRFKDEAKKLSMINQQLKMDHDDLQKRLLEKETQNQLLQQELSEIENELDQKMLPLRVKLTEERKQFQDTKTRLELEIQTLRTTNEAKLTQEIHELKTQSAKIRQTLSQLEVQNKKLKEDIQGFEVSKETDQKMIDSLLEINEIWKKSNETQRQEHETYVQRTTLQLQGFATNEQKWKDSNSQLLQEIKKKQDEIHDLKSKNMTTNQLAETFSATVTELSDKNSRLENENKKLQERKEADEKLNARLYEAGQKWMKQAKDCSNQKKILEEEKQNLIVLLEQCTKQKKKKRK